MRKMMVLFDFDGVLANTEEQGYYILSEMLKEHGYDYKREDYVEMLSGMTKEAFHDYIRKMHPDLPPDFEAKINERMQIMMENDMKAIDGVAKLLDKLQENNIPFAVCSNSGFKNLKYKLRKIGLYDYFKKGNRIYSLDHVDEGRGKPTPDMYLLAADDHDIDPGDCIVVEDSITGTKAGIAAGMHVMGFVGEAHRHDAEADLLVKAGAEMIAFDMRRQAWKHIADFAGIDAELRFPYLSTGIQP